ncbi:peptidoglycan editing factor PgeF [Staphylococcus chromogenes]|uniref:peptidoglycan editing factor PgeF n=1 Tax=Staphylococcus chromogenes TaxID=46126 RepID=UPI000D02DE86|nr:peptidoglycan editing factor PgeF [Staphylococcus chromogenes]PTF58338.1 peptidoglycan editing factor PgeF [Staphylococcus chromogenes]PTF78285.1 peptidoglycan editing factor PgeF [Staphylococcus chromogenes]PTF89754.1 peptidoglycan editing factor PgeF [Staphylococcus chromogenes]PTG46084.1 peptidoglycan editing factor PgeF [Staphylococcus chromogenes]PUZ12236.1 peptidoglycan editing factor PgeF [Staphylococcus chromogenes]
MHAFSPVGHYLNYVPSQNHQVLIGMSTRQGGLSPFPKQAFNMARYIDDDPNHITEHQKILAQEIGFPTKHWVFPIQTHEAKVVKVHQKDRGTNINTLSETELFGVDGLYTFDRDVLLTMCYADCVPIYFYSPKHHFIGLVHAGWRGTVKRIVEALIKQYPFDLNDLYVVIGPSTSNSYEINDDILSQFKMLPIDESKYIETRGSNRHGIDLKLANQLLCEYLGVPHENIYRTTYATSENLELFFSYRVEKGNTGRMLAFIGQH